MQNYFTFFYLKQLILKWSVNFSNDLTTKAANSSGENS